MSTITSMTSAATRTLVLVALALAFGARLGSCRARPFLESVGGGECEYDDGGTDTRYVPILLAPRAGRVDGSGKTLYLAPDLDDILDQQTYNVYHEEVHGTILMPRVKFSLSNDDQPLRDSDRDYDYTGGKPYPLAARAMRRSRTWQPRGRRARYPMSRVNPDAPVAVQRDPGYRPTLEEMIPYGRIRPSADTYIVMADDPVVVVDSVPLSVNGTQSTTTTTSDGVDPATAADGATTTVASRRRRRR